MVSSTCKRFLSTTRFAANNMTALAMVALAIAPSMVINATVISVDIFLSLSKYLIYLFYYHIASIGA
jgi:hypothetical protein